MNSNRVSYQGLEALRRYPKEELYRLIVDGVLHKSECGWIEYEKREEGSLKATFKGLATAIESLDETTLTLDLIREIHRACTTGIDLSCFQILRNELIPFKMLPSWRHNLDAETLKIEERIAKEKSQLPGTFRDKRINFLLTPGTLTYNGLIELFNTMEAEQDDPEEQGIALGLPHPVRNRHTIDMEQSYNHHSLATRRKEVGVETNEQLAQIAFPVLTSGDCYFLPANLGEKINEKIEKLVSGYNTAIEKATDQDEKLAVIIDYIYQFEHLHPFRDANIRTFVICLLNRLLLQNNFLPATFEDPNRFDGYSKKELIDEVKQAMQYSTDIIAGKKEIFGFRSTNISKKYQEKYDEIISQFILTLETKPSKKLTP